MKILPGYFLKLYVPMHYGSLDLVTAVTCMSSCKDHSYHPHPYTRHIYLYGWYKIFLHKITSNHHDILYTGKLRRIPGFFLNTLYFYGWYLILLAQHIIYIPSQHDFQLSGKIPVFFLNSRWTNVLLFFFIRSYSFLNIKMIISNQVSNWGE